VLEHVGHRLGVGLTGIVNALDPEVVVIGGGAVAAGDLLLDPARAVLAERALPPGREPPPIRAARFGDESGMLGAAVLAMEEGEP
jgi:glucokinase